MMLKGFLDKVISGIKMGDDDDFYDDDDLDEEEYDDEEGRDDGFLDDSSSDRGEKKSLFGKLSSGSSSSRKETRAEEDDLDSADSQGSGKNYSPLEDELETSRTKEKTTTRFSSKEKTSSYRSDSSGRSGGKITPMRTRKSYGESAVCILKPANIEEASQIGDHLQNNDIVILHVEGIDTDNAQRIVDFASGCVYALEARLSRVSDYFFVLTPQSVVVSGDSVNPTEAVVANVRSEY